MKDYTKFMKWAVVYMIDRKTQDNRKSKVQVEALFSSAAQANDNYIIHNPEHKRYIIHVDDLEEFETIYNQFQDLHPEDKDNFEINLATLKAVKVAPDEWEKLNKAASWGIGNLKQAEKALKSKRHGYTADRKRAAAELTINIFRRICK